MEKKTIAVIGMACAGCAANVERRLSEMKGISHASVNFAARTALVEFDPEEISPREMKESIQKIGFDLVVDEEQNVTEIEKRNYRLLCRRVILSWIFAI